MFKKLQIENHIIIRLFFFTKNYHILFFIFLMKNLRVLVLYQRIFLFFTQNTITS